MNIATARDHLFRAKGHITSALSWLEEADPKPRLSLATTRELLDEIKARIEVDGNLDDGRDYKLEHTSDKEA